MLCFFLLLLFPLARNTVRGCFFSPYCQHCWVETMAHITQARNTNVLDTFTQRRATPIGHRGRCSTARLDGGGCQSKPAREEEGEGGGRSSESACLVEEKKKGRTERGGGGEVPFGSSLHTHTLHAGMRLNLSEGQPLFFLVAPVYTL